MASEYEGTKITDIPTVLNPSIMDGAKVLIVTADNQHLVPMSVLVDYLKGKINTP